MVLCKVRARCPAEFDAEAVVRCFDECQGELAPKIAACRGGSHLFEYNMSMKPYDKKALYANNKLLGTMLMSNDTGVFKKSVLNAGLAVWNDNNGHILTANRSSEYLSDQGYVLQHMLLTLKDIKKGCTTGSRLPTWLKNLIDLLPVAMQESSTASMEDISTALVPVDNPPSTSLAIASPLPAAKVNKKFILRRVSSCASSTSAMETLAYPEMDATEEELAAPQMAVVHKMIKGEAHAIYSDGTVATATSHVAMANGFTRFFFDDGTQWTSTIPVLGLTPSSPMKKPAATKKCPTPKARQKTTKSTETNRIYSRAYHQAKKAYMRQCNVDGVEPDLNVARERAKAAAQAAVRSD